MNKPLVSFILLTYNQEDYIEDAVHGALSQTYSALEIIISDDCSTDETWKRVYKAVADYDGPHLIRLNRNNRNLGINQHINVVMGLAEGQFIVVGAGDDISFPQRTEQLVDLWKQGATGVYSNALIIDQNGNENGKFVPKGYRCFAGWQEMVKEGSHGSWGCAFSWDKQIFETFGNIPDNVLGEDAYIPFRCALLEGGVHYIDDCLVKYRDHGDNVSFWAKLQISQGAERLNVMRDVLEHNNQLYLDWEADIKKATTIGIVAVDEAIAARDRIKFLIKLRRQEMLLLQGSRIMSVLRWLEIITKGISSQNPREWLRDSTSLLLRSRFPYIYEFVRTYVLGKG